MRTHGPRRASASGFTNLSLAGWWHTLVSVPIFQFLLVRWYFRLFIWTRFLWQVSRIELQLVPTHPDRAGGLGFLANIVYAFAPLLLAHGALLAGLIADRIFFAGAKLPQFTRGDCRRRRRARLRHTLSARWCLRASSHAPSASASASTACLRSITSESSTRSGSAATATRPNRSWAAPTSNRSPISRNSFEVIQTMRIVPFSKETVFQLGVVTLSPLLPLTLTMISFEELLTRLLSAVF